MQTRSRAFLLADDDTSGRTLVIRALRSVGVRAPITPVSSGIEAVAYLEGRGEFSDRDKYPYPGVVLTDLNMAEGDGLFVLQHLHDHPRFGVIPTLVLSDSSDPGDVVACYQLGATAYLLRPVGFDELCRLSRLIHEFWGCCQVPGCGSNGEWEMAEPACRRGNGSGVPWRRA